VVALRRGRTLMGIALLIFMFGFVFFESILGISQRDYGGVAKAALPLLLIVIGAILLIRSIQRSRRAQ
jgi:ABC-type polysaccharide/polyol phosphate export permease